jgi:hypothetical protein
VNTKKSQVDQAVSILARMLRSWRHILPGAVMVVAMAGATAALAQVVTGDDVPPIVQTEENVFALPCDTSFTGCRVDGKKILAISQEPGGHLPPQIFLEALVSETVGRGQGLIFFLGKLVGGISSEEVCVTTVRRGGNPALRERVNCVEIGVDPGFCADGGCTTASTCPDQPALSIGTDAAFCAEVLPILRDAYNVPDNVELAYAMAYSGDSPGADNWARVVKCSSAIRHRCTPNTVAVVAAGMREEPVLLSNTHKSTQTGGSNVR